MTHVSCLKRSLLFFLLLAASAALVFSADTGNLRVGAFRQDITPDNYTELQNLWQTRFEGVRDRIYARALVLDNGSTSAAIVAVDTVEFLDATPLVQRVAQATGIPAANIIITASHNHNSPMIGRFNAGGTRGAGPGAEAWIAKAEKDILTAVTQAKAKLQPAKVGIGTGKAYVNINRNELTSQGYKLGNNPDGPSDKTVWVLRFETTSGEPIAVLMNYAVHAVVMGPENRQLTGDLPGAAARFVESRYQDKVVALWTMGAAGDQNPVYMTWDTTYTNKTTEPGFSLVDTLGQMVGEEVVRVANGIKTTSAQVRLYAAEKTVSCPGQKLDPEARKRGENVLLDADPVKFRLGLLMINDIALATVSGEVYTNIYWHLKKDSPFTNTIMVTLGNGRIGYILDDAAYETSYRESVGNAMKKGCAENTIVNGILEMMGKR